jgi:DNA-binding NarL/FixJ family response regulator/peptidoglycan hydrolase-like protein with peptidoglycan-binding domain
VLLAPGSGYQQAAGSGSVRALQRRLARLGLAPGPIDGRYGPLTTQAVERFQAAHRLPVDGVVGPRTRSALSVTPNDALLPGAAHQQAVRALQRRLARLGLAPGPIDGRYGPLTTQAVERFQAAHRLPVDGVVGLQTLRALQQSGGHATATRPAPKATTPTTAQPAPRPAPTRHAEPNRATPRWTLLLLAGLTALGLATILHSHAQTRHRRRVVARPPARGLRRTEARAPSERATVPDRAMPAQELVSGDEPVRVLVASHDDFARRTIPQALHRAGGLVVVAAARGAREALELTRYHRPAVLILDTALPPTGCLAVIREVVTRVPETQILTLADDDDATALAALRIGAAGHLGKGLDGQAVARVVLQAAHGEAVVPRRLAMPLLGLLREVPDAGWRPLRSRLTTREWQIVELLAGGASTERIAAHLVLSPATVYSHVKSVLRKLGVNSRHDAVIAAERLRREEMQGRDGQLANGGGQR